MVRDASEMSNWINQKVQQAPEEQEVDIDLEQVEVIQRKYDDQNSEMKANEVRLAEMNEIAVQLSTLGQTEAAIKIQTQLEEVKQKFTELQEASKKKIGDFERAHEVQRFHRKYLIKRW